MKDKNPTPEREPAPESVAEPSPEPAPELPQAPERTKHKTSKLKLHKKLRINL